jgi:hypothetical protein
MESRKPASRSDLPQYPKFKHIFCGFFREIVINYVTVKGIFSLDKFDVGRFCCPVRTIWSAIKMPYPPDLSGVCVANENTQFDRNLNFTLKFIDLED